MSKKKSSSIKPTIETDRVIEIAQENHSPRRFQKLPYLLLLIAAIFVYGNSTLNEYALDDQLAIYDNKFVLKGVDGLKDIFTKDAFVGFFGERGSKLITGGRYRPLSFATFALEYELYGLQPHISHAINLMLYVALAALIYYFLSLIYPPDEKADSWKTYLWSIPFIASMLYLLHPIHTEVVANIKGRDEMMCLIFSLSTVIFSWKYWESNSLKWLAYAFIAYFLALMSKENAITFLAIIPLVAYIFRQEKFSKILTSLVPVLVATGIFLLLRKTFTATGVNQESPEVLNNPWVYITDSSQKYATILHSYLMYFKLLIFPHPLTHDYYYNQIPYKTFSDPTVILSILIHIGLFIIMIQNLLKRTLIGFAIAFYFITFSIVSNIPFTVGIIMNERFVFISSIGFALLMAHRLINADGKWKVSTQSMQYAFIAILSLYSIKSFTRNFDWKDNTTLFENDIKISTNSAKVATALGAHYLEIADSTSNTADKQSLMKKAQEVLFHSLEVYPQNSGTYLLLGNAEFKLTSDYKKSIEYFRTAIRYRPEDYFDGFFNMAATFMNMNEFDSSHVYAQKAYAVNPQHPTATKILAFTYLTQGNLDSASALYDKYQVLDKIKLFNTEEEKMIFFADNLKDHKQFDKALAMYNQILLTNPQSGEALFGKAIVLGKHLNQLQQSIPLFEAAIRIQPDNTAWMEDLAVAYGFTKQYAKTIPLLEKVIKANPHYANAYMNLATSYSLLGNNERANYYKKLAEDNRANSRMGL